MKTHVIFTRSQTLLYYFTSFIGSAPCSITNKILRPVGFLRKAYAVILAILSSWWIYFAFFYRAIQGVDITSMNQFIFVMTLTLMGGNLWVTLLFCAFKSNKMIDIINQIFAIKDELKNLGIKNNCEKNCEIFYKRVTATSSVVIILSMIIVFTGYDQYSYRGAVFVATFWIGSILISIHNHCVLLIFVETMSCIRALFESLNKQLQVAVKANCNVLSLDERWDSSVFRVVENRCIANRSTHTITLESENIQLSVDDVEKIGKLHRELCDLVESTTNFYTFPLLFAITRHFITILLFCYSMYAQVFISHDVFEIAADDLPWAERLVASTMLTMLELFLIAHASTSVSKVGNATKVILHETWNKYYPEKQTDELLKFSLQLLHKQVTVSAFGFFDFGYSCLYKMFCALVAYFIIVIQLDTSQPNFGT